MGIGCGRIWLLGYVMCFCFGRRDGVFFFFVFCNRSKKLLFFIYIYGGGFFLN